jgi:hypothetical protein
VWLGHVTFVELQSPYPARVYDYSKFLYSKREVGRAGKALRGDIIWSPDARPEILHVFAVANSWRDSRLFPMRHMRVQLAGQMKRMKLDGVTAARLKRMPSIKETPADLHRAPEHPGPRRLPCDPPNHR